MASRSLNKVQLIGNLTRDPELRYTPQGTAVCQFGLATNRDWVTSSGEKKEDVQYHRIVVWSKLAELCGQLLGRGSKVYVEGRIVYRSFTAKDGTEKSVTEIVMDTMILLGNGKLGGKGPVAGTEAPASATPAQSAAPAVADEEETMPATEAAAQNEEVGDDDIPF